LRVLSGNMPKNIVNKDVLGKSRIGL